MVALACCVNELFRRLPHRQRGGGLCFGVGSGRGRVAKGKVALVLLLCPFSWWAPPWRVACFGGVVVGHMGRCASLGCHAQVQVDEGLNSDRFVTLFSVVAFRVVVRNYCACDGDYDRIRSRLKFLSGDAWKLHNALKRKSKGAGE